VIAHATADMIENAVLHPYIERVEIGGVDARQPEIAEMGSQDRHFGAAVGIVSAADADVGIFETIVGKLIVRIKVTSGRHPGVIDEHHLLRANTPKLLPDAGVPSSGQGRSIWCRRCLSGAAGHRLLRPRATSVRMITA
jgi:hypothetical protein